MQKEKKRKPRTPQYKDSVTIGINKSNLLSGRFIAFSVLQELVRKHDYKMYHRLMVNKERNFYNVDVKYCVEWVDTEDSLAVPNSSVVFEFVVSNKFETARVVESQGSGGYVAYSAKNAPSI